MVGWKADAKQISEFLERLSQEDWVRRSERRWWPRLVFHYTDIRNAINILKEGYLYGRRHAEDQHRLQISSGSPSVLASTQDSIKDCVRLYFRPKTPTQYHAEGIQSQSMLSRSKFPDAHCPAPVFFLFNAAHILARNDCRFSDGNLGSPRARLFSTASELEQLPWKDIYHSGYIDYSIKQNIVFRRCAEVIVPRRLDLGALRNIYCRSDAEKETLLHLLSPELRRQYQDRVLSATRNILFHRRHTFVSTARLSSGSVYLSFSPETESPGPFQFSIALSMAGRSYRHQDDEFILEKPFGYRLDLDAPAQAYTVQVTLDKHLAYANAYEDLDVPF
jgi:ssDNA thymidine ADP-ribosyltransferase DarT-like protein